jgi:hypothetical protein
MWPSVGLLPNHIVGISRVHLYFALFFTASGWLPARSLTSLSATAQSAFIFYHLTEQRHIFGLFLYWNWNTHRVLCRSFIMNSRFGQNRRLDESLFFFLVPFYYFVGTNKYNLCQGCLRGGFDVGHFRYKRTRLVHRTLGRPMTSSDPPTPLGLVCRSFFANQFIDRPLDGITSHF